MKEILPIGLQELGSQSGGGNDNFAQGVGPTAGSRPGTEGSSSC